MHFLNKMHRIHIWRSVWSKNSRKCFFWQNGLLYTLNGLSAPFRVYLNGLQATLTKCLFKLLKWVSRWPEIVMKFRMMNYRTLKIIFMKKISSYSMTNTLWNIFSLHLWLKFLDSFRITDKISRRIISFLSIKNIFLRYYSIM